MALHIAKSVEDLAYGPLPLQTFDVYVPELSGNLNIRHKPKAYVIYVHGGAFRDPEITSKSIKPSLTQIFEQQLHDPSWDYDDVDIVAVVSMNYRLSPYVSHPTCPSQGVEAEPERNVTWPTHLQDVCTGIEFVSGNVVIDIEPASAGQEHIFPLSKLNFVLIGHSVGATMAMAIGLSLLDNDSIQCSDKVTEARYAMPSDTTNLSSAVMKRIRAIILLEGIYDPETCRNAHLEYADVYNQIFDGALGPNWNQANLIRMIRDSPAQQSSAQKNDLRYILLAHSRADELVEFEQTKNLAAELQRLGRHAPRASVFEIDGRHDQIVEDGCWIGRLIHSVPAEYFK